MIGGHKGKCERVAETARDQQEGIRTWPGLGAILKRTKGGPMAKWGLVMLHPMLPTSSKGMDEGLP